MGQRLRLPGMVGYNPAMWDKVVETPTMVAAIAFTASGKKKMRDAGREDAGSGEPPRFTNQPYSEGYAEGLADLAD